MLDRRMVALRQRLFRRAHYQLLRTGGSSRTEPDYYGGIGSNSRVKLTCLTTV